MPFQKVFDQQGDFEALRACQAWLTEHGYSYGSTCVMCPMPVLKGDWLIAKWKNLTKKEIAALDGQVDGDTRNGPVILRLKEAPEGVAA